MYLCAGTLGNMGDAHLLPTPAHCRLVQRENPPWYRIGGYQHPSHPFPMRGGPFLGLGRRFGFGGTGRTTGLTTGLTTTGLTTLRCTRCARRGLLRRARGPAFLLTSHLSCFGDRGGGKLQSINGSDTLLSPGAQGRKGLLRWKRLCAKKQASPVSLPRYKRRQQAGLPCARGLNGNAPRIFRRFKSAVKTPRARTRSTTAR